MKCLFTLVLYKDLQVKTKKFKFHNSTFITMNKSTLSINFLKLFTEDLNNDPMNKKIIFTKKVFFIVKNGKFSSP